jgi:integrase
MKEAKVKTIRNDTVVIRQLVNFAIRRRMIQDDPLAGLKFSQISRTPQPFWTRDQVEKILQAASAHYRPLFQFLADTGTRVGEGRWLVWCDVEFGNNVVHIRPKDGWRPKSGDQRVIPLSKKLYQVLAELPRSDKWVFTAPRTKRFPDAGRQISERRALAHLKTVLKKLGLTGHLHTFRHSFISHALISGAREAMVRGWAGHVDSEILKVYTHIADRQSRNAMDEILPDQTISRCTEKVQN